MKVFYVPIEPYEERYTEQWYRWYKQAFEELGQDYEYIDGESIATKIQTGSVLDAYGTNYYKASQLMKIIEKLQKGEIGDDDVIFFADLWFPGIESLQYIRDITKGKWKIVGILHAGTWDKADFTYREGMKPWAADIESGWLKFFDKVFVATHFHRNLITKANKGLDKGKIVVTGLPFDVDDVTKGFKRVEKKNQVVFPHRLDAEKQPERFDELTHTTRHTAKNTGFVFLKSKEITKTKKQYYKLLNESKIAVSFALQETFGYAMLEALAFRCIPVVPNRLSYKEMAFYGVKYKMPKEAALIIRKLMKGSTLGVDIERDWETIRELYKPRNVIKRMLESV